MPATGESTSLRTALVTADPISTASLAAQVDSPLAGAVVTFSGDVRDHAHGRQVTRLVYEAHPSAHEVLSDIANEVAERYEIIAVAVAHRTGPLAIGDCALAAVVSAAHRGEAFAACTALVEETKARIPVWKHQFFADGTDEWVNCA
ncbi:MAG: molybdenum cofactor biosynthesis protein MoaE [Candidatus Nanopelagicales bacterium]